MKNKIYRDPKNILIATSMLTPPDNTGSGRRLINYLEYFTENYGTKCIIATTSNFYSKNIIKYNYPIWPKYLLIKIPFLYKIFSYPLSLLEIFLWMPLSIINSIILLSKYPRASILVSSAKCPIGLTLIFICILINRKYCLGTTLNKYDDELTLLNSKLSFLYALMIKNAKHFILISPALDSVKYSLSGSKVLIANGIRIKKSINNHNDFDKKKIREKLGIPNRFTLINVGKISNRKNSIEIFKLINYLKNNGIFVNLISLGPFDFKNDSYSKECYKYIEEKSLKEFIFNFGYVNDTEDFYKASNIYVSSSLSEGFPNAIIEAMSYSLPPVHYYLLKTSEYILGDFLVKELTYNNNLDFYRIIRNLIKDKKKCIDLGMKNQEKVKDFDIKNIIPKYKEILFD